MFSAILAFILGKRGYSAMYTFLYIVLYMVVTALVVGIGQALGFNALVLLAVYIVLSVGYVFITKSKKAKA